MRRPVVFAPRLAVGWPEGIARECGFEVDIRLNRPEGRGVGTGSHLPEMWNETCATADIIEYGGERRVKVGREFLFRR